MGAGADLPAISILIADDHPLVAAGLAALAGALPGVRVAASADHHDPAVTLFRQLQPTVVLIDLARDRIDTITRMLAHDRGARIAILAAHDGAADIRRGMQAGALGYLFKRSAAPYLEACIRSVATGEVFLAGDVKARLAEHKEAGRLSPRELDILMHLSSGKSNKLIARSAGIEVGTVKFHVNNILAKLQVASRTEAAFVAARCGLLSLP